MAISGVPALHVQHRDGTDEDTDRARVLVVCGQQIVRSGLAAILRGAPGIGWVGEASSSEAAIRMAAGGRIDVVVLDHCPSPRADGPGLLRKLTSNGVTQAPGLVVVVETDEGEQLMKYLQAGARGLVSRLSSAVDLLDAVRSVARGEAMLSPAITRRVLDLTAPYLPAAVRKPTGELDKLTRRELEILVLVADGLSNADIAHTLQLSYKTVKFHVSNILRKLSVRTRAQAIVYLRPSMNFPVAAAE
jgi:DNA-binding NarL/FixJ family response regulator